MVSDDLPDELRHRLRPLLVHRAGVDDVHAPAVGVRRADADLHRFRGVDQPQLDRLVDEGAVVDPLEIVVGPGIGMGVELDQRQGAVFLGIGLEDREGDEMVAAQGDGADIGGEDPADMRLDQARRLPDLGVIEGHVAVIHDGELAQRVEIPAVGRIVGLQGRGLADRARPEPRAGPVGHGLVEGHARHGEVHAGEVLCVLPPQERGRPREGVLEGKALQVFPREGIVDLRLRILERHRPLPQPCGCADSTSRTK